MTRIGKFASCLCLTAGLGFGMTEYRGQLMDATCYNQNPKQAGDKSWVRCAPTASTNTFAVHTNGRVRMLDSRGNDKAQAAFQQGVLKRDANGDMPIVLEGWRHGNTIKVESIRARGSDTSVH
jgi:hypothetical protein